MDYLYLQIPSNNDLQPPPKESKKEKEDECSVIIIDMDSIEEND